jgi:ankyrin repeat protein
MDTTVEERLLDAFRERNAELAQSILETHLELNVNEIQNQYQMKPLHYAARDGYLTMVRYLVTVRSADVDAPNSFGETPFFIAAGQGHLNVCKLLAEEKGANVNTSDQYGRTAFIYAAEYNHLPILQYLETKTEVDMHARDKSKKRNALMYSAIFGFPKVCEFLVEKGVDINAKDVDGRSALYHAVAGNRERVCHYLLKKGANIDDNDDDGVNDGNDYAKRTMVQWTCIHENVDLFKRFCLAGTKNLVLEFESFIKFVDKIETKLAILRFLMREGLRQTMIAMVSAKACKRVGIKSSLKPLSLEMFPRIFYMLGGLDLSRPAA